MDKRELRARVDTQVDEWMRNIGIMKAKAEASTGDAKVQYLEAVSELEKRLDEFKIQAAKAWDSADESWDSTSKDLELKWAEWQIKAKHAWDNIAK